MVYVLFYIHTDKPEYSEILGVFTTKEEAVNELLERANYRNNNGVLTQYMLPCNEYDSFEILSDFVTKNMELVDTDIYRISELPIIVTE